jgi:hypothetical protein
MKGANSQTQEPKGTKTSTFTLFFLIFYHPPRAYAIMTMPIMRKANPKILVSNSPVLEILSLKAFRAVASNKLRKTTGKAWPKPNMKSNRPPWNAVGAVKMVSSIAGKTSDREHGPRAMDIITPKRNEPIM